MSKVESLLLADTTLLRLLLTIIAILWAALLWLQALDGGTPWSEHGTMWAGLWTLLSGVKLWRLVARSRNAWADLLTHSFSAVMFSSSIVFVYLRMTEFHHVPPDLADDIGCVLASIWLLIRTSQTAITKE